MRDLQRSNQNIRCKNQYFASVHFYPLRAFWGIRIETQHGKEQGRSSSKNGTTPLRVLPKAILQIWKKKFNAYFVNHMLPVPNQKIIIFR